MIVLKILRKLLECEKPLQNSSLELTADEEKWYKIGFRDATSGFETMLDLLEEED